MNDQLLGGLGALAGWYLNDQAINDVRDAGQQGYNLASQAGQNAYQQSQFEPFTVTGTTGSGYFNPNNGSVSFGLTPEMQAAQNAGLGYAGNIAGRIGNPYFVDDRALQALGYMGTGSPVAGAAGSASSIFGNLGLSPNNLPPGITAEQVLSYMNPGTDRNEQSIFSMLESMQQPERQRQNLELENRLFGQGRLGVTTDAYGGTPEQLALAKAQQEQMSTNAFNAYRLAQDEAYKNRTANAQEVTNAFGLGLESRGQDISQTDVFGRLGLGAYDRALGERGQNIQLQDIYGTQALGAYRTALEEQGLLGNQMGQFANLAFLPQQILMNQLGLGLDAANIGQTSKLGGAELQANLLQGGLTNMINSNSIATALQANLNRDLTDILLGGGGQTSFLKTIADMFNKPSAVNYNPATNEIIP